MVGFLGEIKCFQSSKRALDFVVTQSIQLMQERRKIDMIITDAQMPVMDGLEMIKHCNQFADNYSLTLDESLLLLPVSPHLRPPQNE